MKFVNVYQVDRKYGGPEEGGWYYNHHEIVEVYPTREENADEIVSFLKDAHKELKYGDIYSVNGGRDLVILIEDAPAKSQTHERPHYE